MDEKYITVAQLRAALEHLSPKMRLQCIKQTGNFAVLDEGGEQVGYIDLLAAFMGTDALRLFGIRADNLAR